MMFIPRLYLPLPLAIDQPVLMDEKIAHYLTHVIRQREGDRVIVFNGQGGEFEASLHIDKKKLFLMIQRFHNVNRASPCRIHLGQAVVRGDRMDYVIQKATELGVHTITPLLTKHSATKLDDVKSQKRLLHWNNISISASEQSGRTDVPAIHPPVSVQTWAEQSFAGISLLFDLDAPQSIPSLTGDKNTAFRIAIGPESGWEKTERLLLAQAGFISCHLGPRILRTETAGMVAISLLQSQFGDLS